VVRTAFDLWVAMITVGALAGLLLGAFREPDKGSASNTRSGAVNDEHAAQLPLERADT
jgi:hypothetical protein